MDTDDEAVLFSSKICDAQGINTVVGKEGVRLILGVQRYSLGRGDGDPGNLP